MYFIIFAFFFLLTSCTQKFDYITAVDNVTYKKVDQISQEEGLSVLGAGGAMMDEITRITFHFSIQKNPDIDEARRLCVRCIEEIREVVNATESLIPYLTPYPFPSEGMDIAIAFCDEKDMLIDRGCVYLGEGGVSTVMQISGFLSYGSYNARSGLLEPFYKESYEEALRIYLEQANPNLSVE